MPDSLPEKLTPVMAGELRCCANCEFSFADNEVVWLNEDDSLLCDDCHDDEVCADPFDSRYHGHPYYISIVREKDAAPLWRLIQLQGGTP
jgi:hypothetical protein